MFQVCNHPELFERRDVKSPLFIPTEEFLVPKLIADTTSLSLPLPSKLHLLYNKFSIFAKEYVHRNIFNDEERGGIFSFTRFIDISAEEISNVTLGEWYCL